MLKFILTTVFIMNLSVTLRCCRKVRLFRNKATVYLCRKLSDVPISSDETESTTGEKPRRTRRSPGSASVLLFPGQGSQFVGMGKGLLKYGNVKEMFAVAQKVLGYDLLSLCLNGPEKDLMKTVHCQPAVFVCSLAAVERLNHDNPAAIESCVTAAGFSVGEFAALVFSGAMNFAEALFAVKVRAEAMQKASDQVPSGMLSVIGQPQANYKYACVQAREHCLSLGIQEPVCAIANYLFPDGRVIAGHKEWLQSTRRQKALGFHPEISSFVFEDERRSYRRWISFKAIPESWKFMRTRLLPVSGAFHTALMELAVEPLRDVLRQIEARRPEISVHSNVDGKRYMHDKHVRNQLAKQLVSPVKWEQTLHEIYERSQGQEFPHTYEVGPGRHLGSTLQKCNMKAFKNYTHVDVALTEN